MKRFANFLNFIRALFEEMFNDAGSIMIKEESGICLTLLLPLNYSILYMCRKL